VQGDRHLADVQASVRRLPTAFLRHAPARRTRCQEILAWHALEELDATEIVTPSGEHKRFSMQAFGAVFAEVAVDTNLALVRVRRLVGAYGAGRKVNPRTARSQVMGGMVGGVRMALLEHTVIDRSTGRVANATLADYLVPVHADMSTIETMFVEEHDPHVNPLGAKGIGELAIVGAAPWRRGVRPAAPSRWPPRPSRSSSGRAG